MNTDTDCPLSASGRYFVTLDAVRDERNRTRQLIAKARAAATAYGDVAKLPEWSTPRRVDLLA